MESSAARQRGEREAPENSNSIGLRRAQKLLELLAAVGVDRRPLRAVRRRELQTVYLAQCFVSSLISLRSELSLEFQV